MPAIEERRKGVRAKKITSIIQKLSELQLEIEQVQLAWYLWKPPHKRRDISNLELQEMYLLIDDITAKIQSLKP